MFTSFCSKFIQETVYQISSVSLFELYGRQGGARWCGRMGRPPAGGGTLTRLSNFFNATLSTEMDSCSFAWCGSLIVTSQSSTFCHVCQFLRIHSIPHTKSGMIFFYFFSRFHVDFSTSSEVNCPPSRRGRPSKSESSQITFGRVTPTFPHVAKAIG